MKISDRDPFEIALSEALASYDAADAAPDGESQRRLFAEARRAAEALVRRFPEEADAHHHAALCWYDSLSLSARERDAPVIAHLTRALELDPNHHFARAYLAYQNFDCERWEQALAFLEAQDHAFFESRGQHWRNLKSEELSLACRMRLSSASVYRADLAVLVQHILDSEEGERPVPLELARTVAVLLQSGQGLAPGVAGAVAGLIRTMGYEDTLREDYQEIAKHEGGSRARQSSPG